VSYRGILSAIDPGLGNLGPNPAFSSTSSTAAQEICHISSGITTPGQARLVAEFRPEPPRAALSGGNMDRRFAPTRCWEQGDSNCRSSLAFSPLEKGRESRRFRPEFAGRSRSNEDADQDTDPNANQNSHQDAGVFLGEVAHKDAAHPGEHAAIVERVLWDKVHKVMANNRRAVLSGMRCESNSLFKGLPASVEQG
jgi:hypothetical protein